VGNAIDAWPIIMRTIVPAVIALVSGVVLLLYTDGISAHMGLILVIDGAIWSVMQLSAFLMLQSEANRIYSQAHSMGGPLEVLMLHQTRSDLSRFYGALFKIFNSVFAGIAVATFIISFVTWPTDFENKVKEFAQDKFLFSSLVILPLSLIATHVGMLLTETERSLPNYATVFAAIFGTFMALYALSPPG